MKVLQKKKRHVAKGQDHYRFKMDGLPLAEDAKHSARCFKALRPKTLNRHRPHTQTHTDYYYYY